jgi:hypothetical protein
MFSSAIELIHSPPDLMTSFERSTLSAQPSGSMVLAPFGLDIFMSAPLAGRPCFSRWPDGAGRVGEL